MIARYRSMGTLLIGWAMVLVSLLIVVAVIQKNFSNVALLVAISIAALAWFIAIRPAIIVREHSLVIRNIIREHAIPWAEVVQISSTVMISVRTQDGRRITSWAFSSSPRSNPRSGPNRTDEVAFELEKYRVGYGS
ncbi:MAG TPA: PH domain-containing protein [Candidatus Nanopelagicaceae bacterium]|nr:PH domain-containing protein [Candidatus Nanopelagicaceae bacterium]